MDSLRQKLESEGLRDVAYMVINHQGAGAQNLHVMLAERLSENIALYKQNEQQTDVWQTLSGEKDDFLIYDRFVTCGALFTFCKKNQKQISFLSFLTLLTTLFISLVIRCGRLTHHISLPYAIISAGHVEVAIKDTYCKRICGECTYEV